MGKLRGQIALVLAISIHFAKHPICQRYFADNVDAYWDLWLIMNNVSIFLFIKAVSESKIVAGDWRLPLDIVLILCLKDLIDRVFFDVQEWVMSDTIIITLLALMIFFKHRQITYKWARLIWMSLMGK